MVELRYKDKDAEVKTYAYECFFFVLLLYYIFFDMYIEGLGLG